jgi:hypothetical protein
MFHVWAVSRRLLLLQLLLLVVLSVRITAQRAGHPPVRDWLQFGADAASSGAFTSETGISGANAASLIRRQVQLDGTVDASAVYLHSVTVNGSNHDVFFVTTSYGKTIAVDSDSGAILW